MELNVVLGLIYLIGSGRHYGIHQYSRPSPVTCFEFARLLRQNLDTLGAEVVPDSAGRILKFPIGGRVQLDSEDTCKRFNIPQSKPSDVIAMLIDSRNLQLISKR